MDPNVALKEMLAHCDALVQGMAMGFAKSALEEHADAALEHYDNLTHWVALGGFKPKGLSDGIKYVAQTLHVFNKYGRSRRRRR